MPPADASLNQPGATGETGLHEAGIDWAARDRYRMLSVTFNVFIEDPAMARSIRWLLEPFRVPFGDATYSVEISALERDGGTERPLYRCLIGGKARVESWDGRDLVTAALQGMYELIPQVTRDFLLVHSGAAVRDGAALLLPGYPRSGKSSTTLELVRTGGFGYLSDELGAIDPVTSRAYPFERAIGVEEGALPLFPGLEPLLVDRTEMPVWLARRFVRPQDLGARTARPAEVRWIVLPTRDWDGPPRLTPISSGDAVEEMARNAFNLDVYGDRGVHLLERVARTASAFRLAGGTPGERAELLADWLAL